jgi:hypothetical protein
VTIEQARPIKFRELSKFWRSNTSSWVAFFFGSIVDNSIPATAFKAMKAPFTPGEREENETTRGLRVADKGFLNTAVIRSEITYIDGDAGGRFS